MDNDFQRFLKEVKYNEDSIPAPARYDENCTDSLMQIHTAIPDAKHYQTDQKSSECNIQFNDQEKPQKPKDYEKYFSFKPVVHNHPAPKENIEDRLLKAGKAYEERRFKMQIDDKAKKMEKEERLMKSGKIKGRAKYRGNVETRLQQYNDKYKNRLEEKRKEREMVELSENKKPEVNKISHKIVKSKNRIECVEDRLLSSGERMRSEKEERLKQAIEKIKALSRGFSSGETKHRKDIDVVDRLTMYQKLYETRRALHRPTYSELSSFRPTVNHTVNEVILSQYGTKRTKSTCKARPKNNCTFKPQLNKMSLCLAEKLKSSEERLLYGKENHPDFLEEPLFAPKINQLSEKLVLNKQGGGSRTERLFQWEEERQIHLEEKRRIIKEKRLQEDENHPFHPTLCTGNKKAHPEASSTINKINSIEKRSAIWNRSKQEKLRALQEYQQEKELNGCTFQPYIYEKPTYYSTERQHGCSKSIDKHVERIRSKKIETLHSGKDVLKTERGSCSPTPPLPSHRQNVKHSLEKAVISKEDSEESENYHDALKNLHKDLLGIVIGGD